MTTALEKVASDIAEARASIRSALAFVNSIGSADQAADAYDRVKLAKEWAKIRKISQQVHHELLTLEMHCLRKIGSLGASGVLRGQNRVTAEWLKDKTDEEISTLIKMYGQQVGPSGVMQRALKQLSYTAGQRHVSSDEWLNQDIQYEDAEVEAACRRYSRDIPAALAAILEECESDGDPVTVWDIGSRVFSMLGMDERSFDWGVRQAMHDVCRRVMTECAERVIPETEAPRFITCLARADESGMQEFLRVPFQSANLTQLADMVQIRKEQAEASARAYERMRELHDSLASVERRHDTNTTLGELAMRLATHLARAS